MYRRHLLIITIFSVLLFSLLNDSNAKISEEDISKFMLGYSSVMNRRSSQEIESFFNSNASPNARFIKNNSLFFPDGSEKDYVENFDMNTSEFIEYLRKILLRHDTYRFTYQIQNIEIKEDIAFVKFSVSEYYSKLYQEDSLSYELQNLTAANCTMTLSTLNSQILIFGSNCIEKITKKKEFI